jgi:hypothetical protein
MARSRKKVPGFSDSEGSKTKAYYLRLMNRRIRRIDPYDERYALSNGNAYRKYVCIYEFRDYNFRYFTKAELLKNWWGNPGELYKAIQK